MNNDDDIEEKESLQPVLKPSKIDRVSFNKRGPRREVAAGSGVDASRGIEFATFGLATASAVFSFPGMMPEEMDSADQTLSGPADMDTEEVGAAADPNVAIDLLLPYPNESFCDMDESLSSVMSKIRNDGTSIDLRYLQDLYVEANQQIVAPEERNIEPSAPSLNNIKSAQDIAKYIEAITKRAAPDGRLHLGFKQTAAGRVRHTEPDLDTIPAGIPMGAHVRKGFVASNPDHLLLCAGYSQLEARVLAHMSRDETLIAAFLNIEDIHRLTAMNVFDVPTAEITAAQRQAGKTLNLAIMHQKSAFETAQLLGLSARETQKLIDKYYAAFPGVRQFMATVVDDARRSASVTTYAGRRLGFRNLDKDDEFLRAADERAARTAALLGSAADLINLAIVKLDSELSARNLKSRLVFLVHDQLVLDVPANQLEETREVVLTCMALGQPLQVPLRIDIGVGNNWMEAENNRIADSPF